MLGKTKSDWPQKPLSEVVDLNPRLDKSAYRDDLEVSFVPMAAVEAGSGRMEVSQTRKLATVKKGYTPFSEGDVLFAKITPCMENGKMAVVPKLTNDLGFGSTEFHVLRPHTGIDPRYVYYFVSSQSFRREAAHRMTGAVGQKRVPQTFLEEASIPVPLFDDQRCIVAEIEKQFSRLDEAIASLKRIKTNLKRYKAAVLKAAVEGKLTEEWCKAHPNVEPASKLLEGILAERRAKWNGKGKYKEPIPPDTSDLPTLPEGWMWATMPQLGELNRGKSKHRPRDDKRLYDGPYPFIQTGDVRKSAGTISKHSQTYSEAGLLQSRLWPAGTLCITIAANIAETGILTYPACFPDSVVGFLQNNDPVITRYVECFLRTAKERLERFAPATAQKNINLDVLQNVAVPLPPLVEQQNIVAEVERRLSVIEELEANIDANLTRADRLRQSILTIAFSGRLASSEVETEGRSKNLTAS